MIDIDKILNNIEMDNLIIPFGRIHKINSTTVVASGLIVAIGDVVKIESEKHLYTVLGMVASIVDDEFTIGFVGEFLSLLGFFAVSPIMTGFAGLTIILGAVYMLVLYKRTFFGPITKPENLKLKDLNGKEYAALIPLVMLVVYLGVYPKPILDPVDKSVKQVVQIMYIKAITPEAKEMIAKVNTIGER